MKELGLVLLRESKHNAIFSRPSGSGRIYANKKGIRGQKHLQQVADSLNGNGISMTKESFIARAKGWWTEPQTG